MYRLIPLAAAACCLTWAVSARAQEAPAKPFVHQLFSDNMVLQREAPIPVWGWAAPGTPVTVTLEGKSASGKANAQGKWLVRLPAFPAGGPYTLTVKGPETVELKNVLLGDVWICSGQSNMEFGIANAKNGQQEIADAHYPQIRLFTVPKKIATEPQEQVNSKWLVCTPENISTGSGGWGGFTAAGYFFGRKLHQDLKVPIGLIHTSWGGTICEAWTSEQALQAKMPDFRPALAQFKSTLELQKKGQTDFGQLVAAWYVKNDAGSAEGKSWEKPEAGGADWKSMKVPGLWEDNGLKDFDGVVWFRKEIDLPQDWAGKDATLSLGPIDDRDTTWVNGVRVGAMDEYNQARSYRVPANALKAGKNVIAIRVLDTGGGGGIYGQPDQLKLQAAGAQPISLAGEWQYRVGVPLAKASPVPQRFDNNPNVVTVLYNGMIAPLLPYAIKGAIWYQGESNCGRGVQYRSLLPTMIRDWRARWGVGEFPFFIVQLANFMGTKPEPSESSWAELREAQLLTAETCPKTGLAVIIDIGEANDIHPKDKQDVGARLALCAEAIAYKQPVEYAGPNYRGMQVHNTQAILRFDHVGGGLVARGEPGPDGVVPLKGFAIAGADKKFVWADATIVGDTVIVTSPQVKQPVAVRYAWADNPVCNLYNKAGLPASPFRTDGPTGKPLNK